MLWTPRFFALFLLAGTVPAGAVLAAKQTAIPSPVDKLHRADSECRDYDVRHMKDARVTAKLSGGQTLYLLPCFAAAYNVVYRVYVFDKRYPDELKRSFFAGYSEAVGWYGKDSLLNAQFDPKTKTLSAFEMARGLGDCGGIPKFQWTDHRWRMIEYRYWGKCDATHMPEDWPVIYRYKKPDKSRLP